MQWSSDRHSITPQTYHVDGRGHPSYMYTNQKADVMELPLMRTADGAHLRGPEPYVLNDPTDSRHGRELRFPEDERMIRALNARHGL